MLFTFQNHPLCQYLCSAYFFKKHLKSCRQSSATQNRKDSSFSSTALTCRRQTRLHAYGLSPVLPYNLLIAFGILARRSCCHRLVRYASLAPFGFDHVRYLLLREELASTLTSDDWLATSSWQHYSLGVSNDSKSLGISKLRDFFCNSSML